MNTLQVYNFFKDKEDAACPCTDRLVQAGYQQKSRGYIDYAKEQGIVVDYMNNQPSAIILSLEEYTRLTEIEEDYFLLLEANKRMEDNGNNKTVSFDSVMSNLGISEDELLGAEDVSIE